MKLFFRETGEGTPLVILHGLYGSSDNWLTFAKSISGFFHVYLVDQRNHGQSPHSDVHTFEAMRDDLLEFMNDQIIEKAIILGHSLGGKTAVKFAAAHPEMVSALIIVDVAPKTYDYRSNFTSGSLSHEDIMKAMAELPLHRFGSREEIDIELGKIIKSQRIRQFLLKNIKRTENVGFEWKINIHALRNNLSNLFFGIDKSEFFSADYPVLFVKGALSDYIMESDYPLILDYFPQAEIKTVDGAGHWVHAEKPEELKELLLDFYKKNFLGY
ncbi:MAG: alpha/beta fold hydrolase [Bacteroidales bacterium]|nr:alpha/beta fold hydrolase [Bacteroidales bacterium]